MEIYKTFWRRLGALIIDGLLFVPLTGLTFFLMWRGLGFGTYLVLTLLSTAGYATYFILMHGRSGQTLGKMATGVKVITIDDQPLTYGGAALRYLPFILVGIITALPMFFYLAKAGEVSFQTITQAPRWSNWLNWIWMLAQLITLLTNPMRRAIHDFLAGTKVVVVQRQAVPPTEFPQ